VSGPIFVLEELGDTVVIVRYAPNVRGEIINDFLLTITELI
jgi:hypothetical protein